MAERRLWWSYRKCEVRKGRGVLETTQAPRGWGREAGGGDWGEGSGQEAGRGGVWRWEPRLLWESCPTSSSSQCQQGPGGKAMISSGLWEEMGHQDLDTHISVTSQSNSPAGGSEFAPGDSKHPRAASKPFGECAPLPHTPSAPRSTRGRRDVPFAASASPSARLTVARCRRQVPPRSHSRGSSRRRRVPTA